MKIKNCIKCGLTKTWNGNDIECPFQESDIFYENWNCGIIGFIRDLCEKYEEDGRITHARHEDTNYVMLYVHEIQLNPNEEENNFDILYVSWYKSRGHTDEMWLLGDDLIPVKPTFSQLISIIEYYKITK